MTEVVCKDNDDIIIPVRLRSKMWLSSNFPQRTSSLFLQTFYFVTALGLRHFYFFFLEVKQEFSLLLSHTPILSVHHFILNVNLMR